MGNFDVGRHGQCGGVHSRPLVLCVNASAALAAAMFVGEFLIVVSTVALSTGQICANAPDVNLMDYLLGQDAFYAFTALAATMSTVSFVVDGCSALPLLNVMCSVLCNWV